MAHKLKWNDLQILVAVAQAGSANAAAGELGINHSTVLRRLSAFEAAHGVKVFERYATGIRPTKAGRDILDAAGTIGDVVTGIERGMLGQDRRLAGEIVLTTTDTFVNAFVARALSVFRAAHPEVCVNLMMTNARLDLERLDADISVRPSRSPPNDLIGRRASGVEFAVYERAVGGGARKVDVRPGDEPWIGIYGELAGSPAGPWMSKNVPAASIVAQANSFVAIKALIGHGMGRGVLPCCLGDPDNTLRRVSGPIAALSTVLWVLVHKDLRGQARVRALSDHLLRAIRDARDRLEGKV